MGRGGSVAFYSSSTISGHHGHRDRAAGRCGHINPLDSPYGVCGRAQAYIGDVLAVGAKTDLWRRAECRDAATQDGQQAHSWPTLTSPPYDIHGVAARQAE